MSEFIIFLSGIVVGAFIMAVIVILIDHNKTY